LPERIRLELHDADGDAHLAPAVIDRVITALAGVRDGTLVTLEGGGDAFCEGLDLRAIVTNDVDVTRAPARFDALLRAIAAARAPVIALVRGPARGGGVGIAAAADLVLATPAAEFGLPETLFGFVPAIVFPVLARRVGVARARWLAMGGHTISAVEAYRLGLVDEVADDLEAALARQTRRFARLDPRAVAHVKAMSVRYEEDIAAYRDEAAAAFAALLASAETRERIGRYLAGGTPWPDGGAP
jgi:enoyl-CoA hydratase/carnithine racemase